jgi:hypothetical protein
MRALVLLELPTVLRTNLPSNNADAIAAMLMLHFRSSFDCFENLSDHSTAKLKLLSCKPFSKIGQSLPHPKPSASTALLAKEHRN